MSNYWTQNWTVWVSAFCVLAIYSYLVRDNAIYRTMMQVFIGVNLGYQAIIQWRDVLYPQWWLPMLDGFGALRGEPGSPWGALWALVGVLGLLFYFQLSRKYFWLSRIVIGITIGIGAGLTFKSQLGQNMPQIGDSFRQLTPAVVATQPRVLLRLPGSSFPPVIDGSLGLFGSRKTVSAVELLGGAPVWTAILSAPVVGESRASLDSFLVPTSTGIVKLERSTGAQEALRAGLAILPASPAARPVTAEFRQPQFSNGVSVDFSGSNVTAVANRDGVAPNVRRGDLLWTHSFSETVQSVQTLRGALLVQGRQSSELWETPVPTTRLTTADYFDNWVFTATMLSVMVYFFFIFPRPGKTVAAISKFGRWMLMIGFGAFFGNTVMTRMSYLLDRLMFLIDEWLRPFYHHLFG